MNGFLEISEKLLYYVQTNKIKDPLIVEEINKLKEVIDRIKQNYPTLQGDTETKKRIEFIQSCLEKGLTKREAARLLCESDPSVRKTTAETIAYIVFSGQFRQSRKGIKKPRKKQEALVESKEITEEDLL